MFDCQTQLNPIVQLSSINEMFYLVLVVTSGTRAHGYKPFRASLRDSRYIEKTVSKCTRKIVWILITQDDKFLRLGFCGVWKADFKQMHGFYACI